jgi:glycosyltransferase involved in cell wall biosynthesis
LLKVFYGGVLSRSRLFPEVVDMIGGLEDVSFRIAGKPEGCYKEVEEKSKEYGNVFFLGSVPYKKVLSEIKKSDIVYSMFDPLNNNSRWGLPNRFFECIMVGKPLLVSRGTYVADLVGEFGCGVICGHSVWDVKNALSDIGWADLKSMGVKARMVFESGWNWDLEQNNLLEAYGCLGLG